MKYKITDYRLKTVIEELGEEYKDLLIERVLDNTHQIDVDKINLSDIIQLDISIKSRIWINKKTQIRNRLCSSCLCIGCLYVFFGMMLIIYTLLSKNNYHSDALMMMSYVMIILGVFISLLSLLYKKMLKSLNSDYRKNNNISPYQIINKWKETEALIHELTPEEESLSLNSMIGNLRATKIISEDDVETINRLLTIRNQIVHETTQFDFSQSELHALFEQTDKTISKMKRLA